MRKLREMSTHISAKSAITTAVTMASAAGSAGTGFTGEVDRIRRALDLFSVDVGVCNKRGNQRLRLEVNKIICRKEHYRNKHRYDALVLQLQADLSHYPSEDARQR